MLKIEKSPGIVGPLVCSLLTALLCVVAVPVAEASWVCSIDQAYPEVSELTIIDGRLIATLGTRFSTPEAQRSERVRLVLGDNGEWSRLPKQVVVRAAPTRPACMTPPPDNDWLRRNYREPDPRAGFDQRIEVCTTDGQTIWGGIGFYGQENGWGVGGLVRQDRASGKFEYLRPYGLREYSVSTLQPYGGQLFLGRTSHGECIGPEPGFGLSYYQEGRNAVYDVPEVCGFAIRSLVVFGDDLWVASDLGLARAQKTESGRLAWQNFVPDLDDDRLMRPVSCDSLYEELLRSPILATATAFDRGYAFEEFWNRLSELRPAFVSRYLRRLHGHAPVPNQ